MSEREANRGLGRRLPTLLVALSIGVAGVAWAGCGGSSDNNGSTGEIQKRVEKGAEEAQKGIEKGKEEAQRGIEEAEKRAQEYGR